MKAQDLAQLTPVVHLDDPLSLAMAIVAQGQPGIVVTDDDGQLRGVVAGSQVAGLALPRYLRGNPGLARTWDEEHADALVEAAEARTLREALPDELPPAAIVEPDCTVIEIALAMQDNRAPLVVVVDDGRIVGAISVQRLLAALLPDRGTDA